MATRADFTDGEFAALQKGLTGSAMLISLSDRDLSDTFGECVACGTPTKRTANCPDLSCRSQFVVCEACVAVSCTTHAA